MSSPFLFVDYFVWHYSSALRDLCALWLNVMWFINHFFSMPLLIRTLFSPWRRITDPFHRGSIEDYMSSFVMNVMTRVFGAGVRLVFLGMGLVCMFICSIAFLISLAVWITLPVSSVFAVLSGLSLLAV
jgi:hypothetical protein